MEAVSIDLENCFGISSLKYNFEFKSDNTYLIYAKNGLMKTSFAKTFEKIQKNKANEIEDTIFHKNGKVDIKVDGRAINASDVFVIKSMDSSYEADISPLLVNEDIRDRLKDALAARDAFLQAVEKASGIKIKKTSQGKTVYELEKKMIQDLGYTEDSILVNADRLVKETSEELLPDVQYVAVFDDTVLKKIKKKDFQDNIKDFTAQVNQVYASFDFLDKGKFTLPKLRNLQQALRKASFFVKGNAVLLTGVEPIPDENKLENEITQIESEVGKLPGLKKIEALLKDAKGMMLKDTIERYPDIVPFLAEENLEKLRRILWISYIDKFRPETEDMANKYRKLSEAIDKMPVNDTPWRHALDIFNERFSVPFEMTIENLKGAIIGESVPKVEFIFSDGKKSIEIDREKLEALDTLSQGEKRALYLLNIIFDVEQIKNSNEEKLLIIDDIADSFDYKNKYAIIEYLLELSELENIKMIILSHNYDFYRTVAGRLAVLRHHKLVAEEKENMLSLHEEFYQYQPFIWWQQHPNQKYILAMIPFMRNLVEYGRDRNVSGVGKDFDFLTSLLHEKQDTNSITFRKLLPVFQEYTKIKQYESDISLSDIVVNALHKMCETIVANDDSMLEDKIVLSMEIRHIAERYMKAKLSTFEGTLTWGKGKGRRSGTYRDFAEYVDSKGNQTRELVNGFNQIGDAEAKRVLSEVNIMTPENIHLNSFMYEPIIDMDIMELKRLYKEVTSLK